MTRSEMARCDIFFLIRSLRRGGAERQLSLLARALHARGLRITVAVFYGGGVLEAELREAGVEVVDLKKGGRWENFGVLRRLVRCVSQRRPRVLHSYMPTQNVLALLLRPWLIARGCAVVCGIRVASLNAWTYGVTAGLIDAMQRFMLSRADRVISNSVIGLTELKPYITEGRGFAIPNGVEADRFEFSLEARASKRAEWSLGQSSVVVGLVGRLDPQKNHGLLIDALRLLRVSRPDVVVVFIGDGRADYREAMRARARDAGVATAIRWVGSTDDVVSAYSALDILCLCSSAEGFPNALAEAMCVGLPCVATDVGDAKILLGDCGWVVPSSDPNALAGALNEACVALTSWVRERPRRRVLENFSVNTLAESTVQSLSPFLGRSP